MAEFKPDRLFPSRPRSSRASTTSIAAACGQKVVDARPRPGMTHKNEVPYTFSIDPSRSAILTVAKFENVSDTA